MDPNFIHMDWERTFDALCIVVVLAIFLERALSVVFQNRFYIENLHRDGMKETLALAAAVAACVYWKFDAVSMVLLTSSATTMPGYVLTGALVAGGSKGAVKLFEDVLQFQSTAFKLRYSLQAEKAAEQAQAASKEAEAAPTKAGAEVARARTAAAVKKAKVAALKAAAEGKVVPGEMLSKADAAMQAADAAVDSKPGPATPLRVG